MDTKRFEELKTRAVQTLYALDTLPGYGFIIHERVKYYNRLTARLGRLERRGEEVIIDNNDVLVYTLDGLEQKLDEANRFIAKVKGGYQ